MKSASGRQTPPPGYELTCVEPGRKGYAAVIRVGSTTPTDSASRCRAKPIFPQTHGCLASGLSHGRIWRAGIRLYGTAEHPAALSDVTTSSIHARRPTSARPTSAGAYSMSLPDKAAEGSILVGKRSARWHREVRLLRVEHGKTGFLFARAPEHKGGAGRPKIVHYSVIAHRTVHVRNAPRADDAPVFLAPHYKAGRKPAVRGARVLGAEGAHNAPTTRDRVPAAPGAAGRLGAFRVSVSESEFECRAALGAPVVHRPLEGRRLRAEAR